MTGEDLGKVLAAARDQGASLELDVALTIVAGACVAVHQSHEAMRAGAGTYGTLGAKRIRIGFDGQIQLVAGSGEAGYRAPEPGRPDRRADVFSLGVMLYEATTGKRPFAGMPKAALEAERPSLVMPGYPPALESIVMRAVAREPGRRQPTAMDLQRQLEGFAREHRRKLSPAGVAQRMAALFPGGVADTAPTYVPPSGLLQFDNSDVVDAVDTAADLPSLARTGQRNAGAPHHAAPATLKMAAAPEMGPPATLKMTAGAAPATLKMTAAPAGGPVPLARTPSASSPPLPGVNGAVMPPIASMPGARASASVLKHEETTAQVKSLAEIERSPSLAEISSWDPLIEPPTAASMLPLPLPLPAPPQSVELALGTEPPDGRLASARSAAKRETASSDMPKSQSLSSGPPSGSSPPGSSSGSRPAQASSPPEPAFNPPEAPAFGPAGAGQRSSASMPVPGNPGAVPIVKGPASVPPMMPMPAGGTLVSSAVRAGNPHASTAAGPSSLSGELVGRAAQSMQNYAQGYAPPVGQGFPSTIPGTGVAPAFSGEPPAAAAMISPGNAPKTMVLRTKRSPLPLIATAVVGIAGAFAGIWFGVLRTNEEPAAASAPAAAPGGGPVSNKRHHVEPDEAPAPVAADPASTAGSAVAAEPTPTPAAAPAPTVPDPAPAPTVPDPTPTPTAAPADPTPTVASEPPVAKPPVADPTPVAKSGDSALIDPAPPKPAAVKPAAVDEPHKKPKPRTEKRRKTEAKEQTWSDDSPFMPVATPKH